MPPATAVHAFAAGSKISAEFVAAAPVDPPATKIRPSASTVAECALRPMLIGGAVTNAPVVSKNSALATGPEPLSPPVIKIRPSCKSADAALLLALVIDPAESQPPIDGGVILPLRKIPAVRISAAMRAGLMKRRIGTLPIVAGWGHPDKLQLQLSVKRYRPERSTFVLKIWRSEERRVGQAYKIRTIHE